MGLTQVIANNHNAPHDLSYTSTAGLKCGSLIYDEIAIVSTQIHLGTVVYLACIMFLILKYITIKLDHTFIDCTTRCFISCSVYQHDTSSCWSSFVRIFMIYIIIYFAIVLDDA